MNGVDQMRQDSQELSPGSSDAGSWMLPHMYDYWDHRTNAVAGMAKRLDGMRVPARKKAYAAISDAISRHIAALSDEQLTTAAFTFAEDLYRTATQLTHWEPEFVAYLQASGATFNQRINERGYAIRYVIDNTYEATDIGLKGPTEVFADWFQAAGFKYVCPQQVAKLLMESDKRPSGDIPTLLPSYIDEGRGVALDVLQKCWKQGDSYCYLDTDSTEVSVTEALGDLKSPGAITIFRNDAPVPGSKATLKVTSPVRPV